MSETTDVLLVRHGETVWHAENRYAGSTDVDLSELGHAQADLLAGWARDAGLDAVRSSPLQRAAQTAAGAAAACGLVAEQDPRLAEVDFGRGEGMTTAEMDAAFPAALAAFRADPVVHHLPGGEDPHAAVARGMAALDDLVAAHAGGRVLVVAHTTLIRLLLCRLLGSPLHAYRRLFPFVRNVALTEVRMGGKAPALLQFNVPLEPVGARIAAR